MAFADIDAIRARAALPPETTTITVEGWGDFRVQRILLEQKQEFQAAVRENDGKINLAAAQGLLGAAVVRPVLTDEDLALFWSHPDYAKGLEYLITQTALWCQATPAAAQEAANAAHDGFPDRADGTEPSPRGGVGPVRDGVSPAAGADPGATTHRYDSDGVPSLDGVQAGATAA
jgi:hypothetical protein